MNISEIKIGRKYSLGNYEMCDISIGFTFDSDETPATSMKLIKEQIPYMLEELKQAVITKK